MAFEKDLRVRFRTQDGEHLRGQITYSQNKVIRIVDDSNRRYTTASAAKGRKVQLKTIKGISQGVFVFDTQLDKGWRSQRRAAGFWEEYARHAFWTFGHERVHSLDDLRYFLERRTISESTLIFNGHSSQKGGFQFSNGERFDRSVTLTLNQKNRGKVVIFSSCCLGANQSLLEHYKTQLHAQAVIAYKSVVTDSIAFLAESALIQLLDIHLPAKATAIVRESLAPWKGINQRGAKGFPIVCSES